MINQIIDWINKEIEYSRLKTKQSHEINDHYHDRFDKGYLEAMKWTKKYLISLNKNKEDLNG